jgi:uncharacterized Zn finger protein
VRKVICPECGEEGLFTPDELLLFGRIQCEECGAVLEVVNEDPLSLEVVDSEMVTDDDEYDEEDEEDEI